MLSVCITLIGCLSYFIHRIEDPDSIVLRSTSILPLGADPKKVVQSQSKDPQ
jgi:hypothetical protein